MGQLGQTRAHCQRARTRLDVIILQRGGYTRTSHRNMAIFRQADS
jgi:hypothetical protein